MTIHKLQPDLLFTGKGEFLSDMVLIHEKGKIIAIEPASLHDPMTVNRLTGIISPGFINTHCHLELSHMKGRIDTGTGLLPFLKAVVGYRDINQEEIDAAITAADKEMQAQGIVAVGDISNKLDTSAVKSNSPIAYYTFVEMFDFMQPFMTEATIGQYSKVYKHMSTHVHNKVSYSPHAPYTVSKGLFQYIISHNPDDATVSIHNQETVHENQLFIDGNGGFRDFFQDFGFDFSGFEPSGKSSIHYAMEHMNPKNKTLLIHNTTSTPQDIQAAHAWSDKVYWTTCANANLYIENNLPDYSAFMRSEACMTIGTDSLSSNWQLSVLDEIKTIKKYNSFIPLNTLLTWATSNGAEALGYDDLFGSFDVGKSPGINLISCDGNNLHESFDKSSIIKLA
jgi:cytosine/adenosine deaminase-related metal-dependent hydrolase